MASAHSAFQACARPDTLDKVKACYDELGGWRRDGQLPVVYSASYNVKLFGLEKLHPFDAAKFEKVKGNLEREGLLKASQLLQAKEAPREVLMDVHTEGYVTALHSGSKKLQEVIEAPVLSLLPTFIIQSRLHRPLRFHVGGTMLALALALESGWSINLGGGMHHANFQNGSGWCAYDDWMLALRKLRAASGGAVNKALYIDLDVHQGNGVARDKLHFGDEKLFILDMYNREIWPGDQTAKKGIDHEATFACGCADQEYLGKLQAALLHSFQSFKPDIVLYNAGTDILAGDPLGLCEVSASAVIKRDEMVWQAALDHNAPICMALSGGYAKGSAGVISRCLSNLMRRFRLTESV